jgi:hypothetical protein
MPSTEKVRKSELTGALDSFLDDKRETEEGDDIGFLTILEFVDRYNLLPAGLYPTQKFILKLYYNLPLDDFIPEKKGDRIRVSRDFRSKDAREMSEVEYLKYLYSQGRCNIGEQDGKERRELILVLGRRSGKSLLSSIIAAYELYKLLRRGDPQNHYGMVSSSEIRILCVANDKEQAAIVFEEMSGHVNRVDYFKSSQVGDTKTFMKFRTKNDAKIFKSDDKKGTLTATFKSSIAKGLRGRGIICMILDELAFFIDDGKSSAKKIYKALTPSAKQFSPKDPEDRRIPVGPTEARVISISSPDAKEGFFYRLYLQSLSNSKASSNMLMIQAPTWEVNPTVSQEDYEIEYAKDPREFATEYGAQFSDRVRGWIENAQDLLDCVIESLRPALRGTPREPHWAGLDFGVVNDGTSVVFTHLKNGKVELAYHETWYAGKNWREVNPHLMEPLVPYALMLQDQDRLDIDEIVNWLLILSKRFYIMGGIFDQYAGPIFEQKMHKVGLTQFSMRRFSTADSSQAYRNAKMMMWTHQLALYDYPRPKAPEGEDEGAFLHSPHISELLELQATSGGKNIQIVEAPDVAGKHDDFSDGLIRSLLLAAEYLRDNPSALEMTLASFQTAPLRPQVNVGYRQYHRTRARLHGPPPRERTVPGKYGRR